MQKARKLFSLAIPTVITKKPKDRNTRRLKLLYSEFHFEQLIIDFTTVATKTSSSGGTSTTKR